MDAVVWLLDHEILMAVLLLAILAAVAWWFNKKNPSNSNAA